MTAECVPDDVEDDSEAADDEHEDALHHELRVLDGPVLHHPPVSPYLDTK